MEFLPQYEKLVKDLLAKELSPDDGISKIAIADFKTRNNLNLPNALKEYYCLLGNLNRINLADYRLLKLDNIFVEAGKLIFMEQKADPTSILMSGWIPHLLKLWDVAFKLLRKPQKSATQESPTNK